MTGNHETIAIGDEVRLRDGTTAIIRSLERKSGLYVVSGHPSKSLLCRHEFSPTKWDGDVIGVTGIGVCAAGGAGQ